MSALRKTEGVSACFMAAGGCVWSSRRVRRVKSIAIIMMLSEEGKAEEERGLSAAERGWN